MDDEIEECIRKKIQWTQLPGSAKRLLGDSQKEYERYIYEFSIKNQLRYRGSLVRTVKKDERKYYEALIQNSIKRLMLFPYHLADMIVKGLRITPFIYYVEVVAMLIELEKSYDTMPNFTAADCLRLLGIGRNEYLELVAKSRSLGRRGRARALRLLLPRVPLNIPMQPWWRVELGFVLEEDVKPLSESEKALIDSLIDRGSQTAGTLDYDDVKTLYRRGLIYLDVPVTAADKVSVPPLKGFVMNRIAGDYFETLLYKVFVSIDEHTTVAELATVLQVESELVKQAVSLYCRLGFAHKLRPPPVSPEHPSWMHALTSHHHAPYKQITPLTFDQTNEDDFLQMEPVLLKQEPSTSKQAYQEPPGNLNSGRRVAVLFDSTLAAYLMMGNLSPIGNLSSINQSHDIPTGIGRDSETPFATILTQLSHFLTTTILFIQALWLWALGDLASSLDLKSHAVTLFEVGKLCDESLDSLLVELDKVASDSDIEGEARRYLAAALCLRRAIIALRPKLRPLDLLRCEALHSLGSAARARLLTTKYRLAISTAPLCREARAGAAAGALPHVGPAPPEATSPWMRLYLYHVAGYGPPTLLLTKGTKLKGMPRLLLGYSRLSVVGWSAEAAVESSGTLRALPAALALDEANSELKRGPVMIQAIGVRHSAALRYVMFPPDCDSCADSRALWSRHAGLRRLARRLRLSRGAGYVTLADIGVPDLGSAHPPETVLLLPPKKIKSICGMAKPVNDIYLSSTDSDIPKSTEEFSKAINDRLQSPIESHFAVTPTAESKTGSPANGLTNSECGELLVQELDNLELNEGKLKEFNDDLLSINSNSISLEELKKDDSRSGSSFEDVKSIKKDLNDLLSPLDESISMFTQLNDKLTEMNSGAEADSGVDMAQNVSDEENCKPEKWTILDLQFGIPLFDEELCEKICQCIVDKLSNPDIFDKIKEDNEFIRDDVLKFVSQCQYYPGEDMGLVKRGSLVPLPRKNLAFENGKITEWLGK